MFRDLWSTYGGGRASIIRIDKTGPEIGASNFIEICRSQFSEDAMTNLLSKSSINQPNIAPGFSRACHVVVPLILYVNVTLFIGTGLTVLGS